MWIRRAVLTLVIMLLPALFLAPVWRLHGLGANEDDILYYYPSRVFLHETVRAGYWPWLNPWNGADRPYAADPQSALWYPVTWLFVVLPPLWAYPLSLWLHYSLALWGMYRLLRAAALDRRAALFGGIAFAFCGFLLAHRAHFTMQQAAAWTPWVFWRLQRYVHGAGRGAGARAADSVRRLVAAAIVAALQCFAGHVQIAAITALGSLVYLLGQGRAGRTVRGAGTPTKGLALLRWLLVWVCVAGLFAVQWLPTLAYVRLCTRVERTYLDFVENSWFPSSALGWVLPMLFGQRTPNFFDQPYWGPSHQCEQFAYAGILPLLLAALGLRVGWRADLRRRPWVVLLIFGVALALGTFGPICPLLYWIPGSALFRVPARGLLLVNLALAALAATTLHDLGATPTPRAARLRVVAQRWAGRPLAAVLLLIGLPLGLTALALPWLPTAVRQATFTALRPWNTALLVPLVLLLLSLATLGLAARWWRQSRWLWLLALLTALDLGIVGWTIDVPAGVPSVGELLGPPDEAWLAPVRESDERLWVVTDTAGVYTQPVHKRAANTNALVHVRSLTDYGPLQPITFHRRFALAPWGVTDRARELLSDTRWMRPFNVGWVLLCEPGWPEPQGCDAVPSPFADARLYHNPSAAGMAFFEDPAGPGAVGYVEHGPAAFDTLIDTWPAAAPADAGRRASAGRSDPRVIVARLALPGWQAAASRSDCTVEVAEGALLSVRVPAGQATTIKWTYAAPAFREGALISSLSAAALAALLTLARRGPHDTARRRRAPKARVHS